MDLRRLYEQIRRAIRVYLRPGIGHSIRHTSRVGYAAT